MDQEIDEALVLLELIGETILLQIVHGASFEQENGIDMDKGEFVCPVCRRVANIALPIQQIAPPLPPLRGTSLPCEDMEQEVFQQRGGAEPPPSPLLRLGWGGIEEWCLPPGVFLAAGKYRNTVTRAAWAALGACEFAMRVKNSV